MRDMIDIIDRTADPMTRLLPTLLAAAVLGSCAPAATPAELQSPAVEIIGFPDDPQAVLDFVEALAASSHASSPSRIVSRSIDGGPAHSRITMVHMSDPGWCGSGGCTLFVLAPDAGGMRDIGQMTLVHPPVIALDTQTNGMPDIVVRVRGDYYPGDGEKFVALQFDGRTYPSNPTVPPARLISRVLIDGEIVISEGDVALAFHR